MLKRFFVILIVCFFLMPASAAYADVIVPPENDFYTEHQDQMVYLDRSFVANGEGGSVSVKKAPGITQDIDTIQNGEAAYIEYSCLYEGNFWGFTNAYSGWVRLDQMLVLYDYVAFYEDHENEFYSYDGDYAEIKEARSAIAWPWPGADTPNWTIEDLGAEYFSVPYAYKDEEGREWGFVTYLFGNRNIWVCLSDPLDQNLSTPRPAPSVWVSETEHVDINPGKESSVFIIIIILVVVVVVVTMVLIRIFWKPNKTKQETKR